MKGRLLDGWDAAVVPGPFASSFACGGLGGGISRNAIEGERQWVLMVGGNGEVGVEVEV